MIFMCGEDIMPPSKKCHYNLKNGYDSCKRTLWVWANSICKVVQWLESLVCPILKILDKICLVPKKIKDNLKIHVLSHFQKLFEKYKRMLMVKVDHRSSMHFNINQTKSLKQASEDIQNNLK